MSKHASGIYTAKICIVNLNFQEYYFWDKKIF